MSFIEFPYQGTFTEFINQLYNLLGKSSSDFLGYDRSSIDNIRRGVHPRSPEATFKVYRAFEVERLTGRSYGWFFDFANFPEQDPSTNALLGRLKEPDLTMMLQPDTAHVDLLIAQVRTILDSAQTLEHVIQLLPRKEQL